MSFEPLKLKLTDRKGRPVAEPVQAKVVRAFERAMAIPDASIEHLVLGGARVARVIAGGAPQNQKNMPRRFFAESPGKVSVISWNIRTLLLLLNKKWSCLRRNRDVRRRYWRELRSGSY